MTEKTYEQQVARRLQQEYAEVDDPVVKGQLQLDRWWSVTRALEADDDMYEVGGFVEYHSRTPSFHKSSRDRDWQIK